MGGVRQGTPLALAMMLAASATAETAESTRFRWERFGDARYKVVLEDGREVARLAYPPRAIPWRSLRGTAIEAMLEGGEDLLGRGNPEDARLLLEEALDQVRLGKESELGSAEIEQALAEVHLSQGQVDLARQRLLRVLAVRKRVLGIDAIELIDPLERLSKLYLDEHQPAKARPVLEWLRAIRRRRPEEWRAASKVTVGGQARTEVAPEPPPPHAPDVVVRVEPDPEPDLRVGAEHMLGPDPAGTTRPGPSPTSSEARPPPAAPAGRRALPPTPVASPRGLASAPSTSKPAVAPGASVTAAAAALPGDPQTLQQAFDRAIVARDLPLAEAVLDRLEAALVKRHGPTAPERTSAWLGRARLHEVAGRPAEAAKLYEKILEVWAEQLGPDHPEVERIGVALADAYLDARDYALAEDYFWRAHGMRQARLGPDHPSTVRLVASLGFTMLRRGDLAQAGAMAQQALQALDRSVPPGHPARAWPETVAGLVEAERKDDAAARAHLEAALAATRAGGERPGPELVRGYAALLRRAGQAAEAQAFEALSLLADRRP